MKVLLVKPYNTSDHIQPSLGLGYLASAARKNHDVRILDCIKEGMPPSRLIKYIGRHRPDVVGIQCYTFDLNNVREILSGVRHSNPGIVTVIGGPHSSAEPVWTMRRFQRDLDYAFAGEAETGFVKLLDALERGDPAESLSGIEGLVYREDSGVRVNPPRYEDDLDKLGLPAWDLIRPQEYPPAQHGAFFKKFPIAPIFVTRGCPFPCAFCAGKTVSGRSVRRHSRDYMLRQISILHKEYGIREFHIVDDNFTMDKAFAKDLLKGIIGLGLDISWAVPNGIRMETLDDEILELMKKSGLYLISLGIESGSDRILKAMDKNLTTGKIIKCVRRIRAHKIPVAGFFILGYIGETRREMEETIRFSMSLGLIRANYFNFLPFPGTASYKRIQEEEGADKIDINKFYFTDVAYTPNGVTRRQLKMIQRRAFLKFYLR
ncbi:MAG: B12-binding domain-containing radical SAM protein, partial [Candidatus Omnitrophica bacterium]|nr:B12-binding domain-containing radical SAM protein [Candidatus Omnitrophota bacterium]